jgi:hypothetical protein
MKTSPHIKCFLFFILVINMSCGMNSKERHFESHLSEIQELISYFKKIVPADKKIEIEFYNDSKLQRLQITQLDTFGVNKDSSYLSSYPLYFEWEVRIASIPDSILNKLNWNQQTFEELKNKLDKAGCISINNENPIEIGYERDFFVGLTTYFIFTNYDSTKLKDIRNRRTDLHFFNDSIAWNYDTGAL